MSIPFADPKALEAHCLPFIRGQKPAPTAADLMASRYVAYTLQATDYLFNSLHPRVRKEADRRSAAEWARRANWQGLEIVSTERGGENDNDGIVEFIARYSMNDVDQVHHERASFERVDGVWYFVDGETVDSHVKLEPIRRDGPKIGRNDPCSCGSGKKYKKCHGAVATAN